MHLSLQDGRTSLQDGWTAANDSGDMRCVQMMLLERGAEVNVQNRVSGIQCSMYRYVEGMVRMMCVQTVWDIES